MHWIVIHLVGSRDVNSRDRATLHTLLPINLLKWISNATLGASADLKLLSQTHTETKTYYFYQFPWFVGKVSLRYSGDVQDKHGSSSQKRDMISLSSRCRGTTTGDCDACYEESECLVGTEVCMRPGYYSGHLLLQPANRCCIYLPGLMLVTIGRCCRVKMVPKRIRPPRFEFVHAYVCSSVMCSGLSRCLSIPVLCLSCRSRLADYTVNCLVTPHTVSTCPNQDNHQACLASYARLIGQYSCVRHGDSVRVCSCA